MSKRIQFNSLLIPTDFSENAWNAFQVARDMVVPPDAEMVVMHVIDPAVVQQLAEFGSDDGDALMAAMRERAFQRLVPYSEQTDQAVQVDTLVCEGDPFIEIIRKADDFAVDAIVMTKLGHRHPAETLLFGSTAEKVVRASRKPVFVLPTNLA